MQLIQILDGRLKMSFSAAIGSTAFQFASKEQKEKLQQDFEDLMKKSEPKKPQKGGHVLWLFTGELLCTHCGETYNPTMPCPMGVMSAILKAYGKEHKRCKLDKSKGLACSYCLKFGHPHDQCPTLDPKGDPMKWIRGNDTGMSSKEIWSVLMGKKKPSEVVNYPHDSDDFGRCHRLLNNIPEWRPRIVEMKDSPVWAQLVDNWDELESLYVQNNHQDLYRRLEELNRR